MLAPPPPALPRLKPQVGRGGRDFGRNRGGSLEAQTGPRGGGGAVDRGGGGGGGGAGMGRGGVVRGTPPRRSRRGGGGGAREGGGLEAEEAAAGGGVLGTPSGGQRLVDGSITFSPCWLGVSRGQGAGSDRADLGAALIPHDLNDRFLEAAVAECDVAGRMGGAVAKPGPPLPGFSAPQRVLAFEAGFPISPPDGDLAAEKATGATQEAKPVAIAQLPPLPIAGMPPGGPPVAPPSPPDAQGTPRANILRGSPYTPLLTDGRPPPGGHSMVPLPLGIAGASARAYTVAVTPPGGLYRDVPGGSLEAPSGVTPGISPAGFAPGGAPGIVPPGAVLMPAQTPSPGSHLPESSRTLRQVWHNFPGGFGLAAAPPPALHSGVLSPAAYHTPVATAGPRRTQRRQSPSPMAVSHGEALDQTLEKVLQGTGTPPLPASSGAAGGRIPKHRTSRYRGVSRHRLTKRWEASCWVNKKQLYLGGFDQEQKAARAYDVAALLFKGPDTPTNYTVSDYETHLPALRTCSQEELIAHIRRHSSAFSRGKSKYRGVSGHHGRWEARIGTYYSRKNVSFGVYDTEEDAARQYDRALIIQRGRGAKTNFDVSAYDQEVSQYTREKRNGASYEEALRQIIVSRQGAEDAKRKARSDDDDLSRRAPPTARQCTRRLST